MLTVGSLFDGAGTMQFASVISGIKPVWSSEIDNYACQVTAKRFPNTIQLGDVTNINGAEIPFVDIIAFGSPCQNLSIAGRRDGLKGSQSSLFLHAIRIIKEMRALTSDETNNRSPRFAIWENVPGAFTTNRGDDFRIVLEEFCKIKNKRAVIPRPPKGKWNSSGYILGHNYSLAWRVLDAQFWGVPQRRRRIWLIADFDGQCAPEILFKRNGLSRSFEEIRKTWETIK